MSRTKVAHRFKVVYEAEPDGSAWNVSIPSIQGCHTYGRSLGEARRAIRECLSLFEEDFGGHADEVARDAVFEEDIRLPAKARAAIKRYERARAKVEADAARLRTAQNDVARTLTETLSLRDAGELLGLSHQGVRKILKAG
jgi:predicted RNase H-like HicB family nuclease